LPPNDEYPDAPDGADTLKEGIAFQRHVHRILNPWGFTTWDHDDKRLQYTLGENPQGFEIKLDKRCFSRDPAKNPTGRLSIEIAEKTRRANADWIDSGILRTDNSWLYVQGNYEIVFVFPKNWLLRFYCAKVTPADCHEHNGTVRKFYIPLTTALVGAALVLDDAGRAHGKDKNGQWTLERLDASVPASS